MSRALRILIPTAVLGVVGMGALAVQGGLNLSHLDLARLMSWENAPASRDAPVAESGNPAPTASSIEAARVEASVQPAPEAAREADAAGRGPSVAVSADTALKIDYARINPDGASVIGGHAPPGSRVSIHGNGQVVATVTAADSGQWSAVVERPFDAGPLALSITSDALSVVGRESPIIEVTVPKGSNRPELAVAKATPRPILPAHPQSAESRAVGEFAAMVERARNTGTAGEGPAAAPEAGIVPVPITFVTGEAMMTASGTRAAQLLAEYVRIMKPGSITLSGHADARGGDDYNLDLSRRRLEAIQAFLRNSGYAGELSLLAKGKSEPYQGIDRRTASLTEVYQADRRVELRLPQ
jgi:outer membrane protein OmpA-like peptidoglycan-associated protein